MTNAAHFQIRDVIERTLYIQTSVLSGTAVAVDAGSRQFLVTAKHVVEQPDRSIAPDEQIVIGHDAGIAHATSLKAVSTSCGDPDSGDVDIAVLELHQKLSFSALSPTLANRGDVYLLQTVCMPTAELWLNFGPQFGMPVRTGNIARVQPDDRGPYTGDFLISIVAYPGFSGSPIVCWDEGRTPQLAGIAARYSWHESPEFGPGRFSTGVLGCFFIDHAVDLIRSM